MKEKREPLIIIDHILESIASVEVYIKGMTKQEFLRTPKTQDAVIRRIEIIGEAVKSLPLVLKQDYPKIP